MATGLGVSALLLSITRQPYIIGSDSTSLQRDKRDGWPESSAGILSASRSKGELHQVSPRRSIGNRSLKSSAGFAFLSLSPTLMSRLASSLCTSTRRLVSTRASSCGCCVQ
jgi:hypothetical protein